MAATLNSTILDSAILHKNNFTHSFWLNLMVQPSWILPCRIQPLPSWIQTPCYLLSDSLKKHSHSTLTLTQTNSIWLKLIHSHSTWWCKTSWILPSQIQPFWTIKNFTYSLSLNLMMAAIFNSTILDSAILHKKTSLIDCHPTWWWQPSWSWPCWIQHCHLGFRHLVIFSQIHSKTLSLHSEPDSN